MNIETIRRNLARGLVRFLKLGGYGVNVSSGGDEGIAGALSPVVRSAYNSHVWAYAGIYAIASAAAGLPIRIMRKIDDKESEPVFDHEFTRLLEEPNEFMTGYDLIELSFIFAESTGRSPWLLDNGEERGLARGQKLSISEVREIWPIPPHMIRPVPDPVEFIKHYVYSPDSGKKEIFQAAEVFDFKYPNPLSLWDSLASLEPADQDIRGDLFADRYNNNFFRQGAIPPAFLKTDQILTPEQRRELRAEWSKLYSGVSNAHKIAFLEAGTELQELQLSRRDMQFVELSREKRTKILGALGVPPVIVGLDTAKYDNAEQQKAIFWEITMLPKLRKFARALTKRLHAMGEEKDLFVMFDTSGVRALQGDYKTQAETARQWWGMGVPANSLIPIFGPSGMETFEGGDESHPESGGLMPDLDPIDVQPAPEGSPEDAPPEDGEEGGDEDGKDGKKAAGDPEKAIDDARWKAFIKGQEAFTRKLRFEVKKLFKSQRRRIIAKVRKHYKIATPEAIRLGLESQAITGEKAAFDVYILDIKKEAEAWEKKLKPIISSILMKYGADTVSEFATGIDFTINNPNSIAFLKNHIPKFTFDVNKTSMERVRAMIAEKFRTGATQKDLVDSISGEFDFFERYRSARIARTESGIAGNAGIEAGFHQAGVKSKRWISSRDAKVRDSHQIADGQVVEVSDPFLVSGVFLQHPGDPAGPIEEIANCRCTMRGSAFDQ